MELYLIRHGQSTNNALGGDQGRRVEDPSLTDLGRDQAQHLADFLASSAHAEFTFGKDAESFVREEKIGYQIDRLYCSAMRRALQTAQPIAAALGLQPEVWLDIHEGGGIYLADDNGVREGKPGIRRHEALKEFPGYTLPDELTDDGWWNRSHETDFEGQGRALRVAAALLDIAKTEDQKSRVALVSHGYFLNVLIKALLNQLPSQSLYYQLHNTAMSRLDISANGRVVVRYWNRTNHLPLELVTA